MLRSLSHSASSVSSLSSSEESKEKMSSAKAKDFLAGNLDPEQYMIVDVSTQYVYTYKHKKTGEKTVVLKYNYLNLETLDFQFQRMVYGTKELYIRFQTGNLVDIMQDLMKDYAENKQIDARLNYESNVFACIVGAIVFSILFMVFSWIVRKICIATFGNCCTSKTKTVKLLDVDVMNNRENWNVHDMSVKKEFKSDETTEDFMHLPIEILQEEAQPLEVNESLVNEAVFARFTV